MKKLVLIAVGLTMACNSSQNTVPEKKETATSPSVETTYAATITSDELKEHLYVYASDEFEGRETGTPGEKKAAAYIKDEYVALGIPAAKENGDYYQEVPLIMDVMPTGELRINGMDYKLGKDVLAFDAAQGHFSDIVYVGYGIDDKNYNDYEGIDIKGKLVLVKFGEPVNADGTFKVTGTRNNSKWSKVSDAYGMRSKAIQERGGLGMLYYDDTNYTRYQNYFNRRRQRSSGGLSLKTTNDNDFINVVLNKNVATALYPSILNTTSKDVIKTALDLNLSSDSGIIESENVVAVIKGTTKPDEYVVLSSHLDHIGITDKGEINNGADDDGSGTVALLEIAEAFKKAADAGNGPKRSIVFLHVTGEEKGLLGSQYYTDVQPIFPLSQTVANLNIDMIGRIDPKREGNRNYVYLIGSDKLSTELHNLSEAVNKKYMNIELDYKYNDENDPNRFYYRSDHYNFAKNNIPIIFYFNGTHADYHRPSDTPDKINYDLLENRTRLVFHTAWEIANRDQKIVVDKGVK
ncbi:M28 family peptidase [Maribacter polysiphoniae]|uniref:M28 family peptidase n=1 Tax=Maribacter polysiphoniae TaxID=429344 RepID=A0A316DTS0_9FLAO|nr:M28 family peptidase [Maribacter polysiphoniae]MBD1262531.1 M28 family peptidase [Maribacter polysiphoniae]PWK21365.1 peptidase M28-like protein [Maribacter polysiphoniae]